MAPPSPAIDFQLRFEEGRSLLRLRGPAQFELGRIDRLDLDVPDLRFPFDAEATAAQLRLRRCRLAGAELRVEGGRLSAWLLGRPYLSRFGIAGLRLRMVPGRGTNGGRSAGWLEVAARARVGDAEAPFTLRLVPVEGPERRLHLYLHDLRLYGALPAPAPLVGLGLALGLGAVPEDERIALPGPAALKVGGRPVLTLSGVDRLATQPLDLLLSRTLPPLGWRLPSLGDLGWAALAVEDEGVALRFGAAAPPDGRAAELGGLHETLREADVLLAAGDVGRALEAYALLDPAIPEVGERRLQVLAASPGRHEEAAALAERLLDQFPTRPAPLLALAALDARRGDPAQAAARYTRLFELAERADEPFDAFAAALRAGEALIAAGKPTATYWLERAFGLDADDARTAELLAGCYRGEQRHRDLAWLERRRLTRSLAPDERAAGLMRLGRLYLEHLGEPDRAREELERAAQLRPEDGACWALIGRARRGLGDLAGGRAAAEKAAALLRGDEAADALADAAEMAADAGDPAAARQLLARAGEQAPRRAETVGRLAALLSRLGARDEAIAAFEHAVQLAEDDATRAPLLCELARLAKDGLGDPRSARGYIERSLALAASPRALALAAELAGEEGRKEEQAALLGRLAAAGDLDAALRRAAVLIDLGRYREAAEAAEGAGPRRPETLRILVEARRALGQRDLLKEALDALAAAGDLSARLALARLHAEDGELERARVAAAELGEGGGELSRGALELLCDVLLRQGDDAALDGAVGRLVEVLPEEEAAARVRALRLQGAARARLGRHADAAASFRAALALDPDDADARAGLGQAAWALGRWDEARAALEPLYARGLPPRVERALRLGEIAERQGKPAEALGYYQGALDAGASGADAVKAWNALAALYRQQGEHEAEARAIADAAEDPRTGEGDAQRAGRMVVGADVLRKRLGRKEEAVALYERALALDPLHMAALDALETLADADEDPVRLEQILSRKVAATAKRPAQQKAILGRLAALRAERLGQPEAAREAYRRALEIDPAFRPALEFLAAEARRRGDGAEERALLERLARLDGDGGDAERQAAQVARLARLAFEGGDLGEARTAAERALRLDPRQPQALTLLDQILTATEDTEALLPVLERRAQIESDPDRAFEHLLRRAELLEASGRGAEARAAYEELTTLSPGHPTAWMRLAALLREAGEWERLAGVLVLLAERNAAEGGAEEAEPLFVEAAHLWHERLDDDDRARAVLGRALEVMPRSKVALGLLITLARAARDGAEEDQLLGRLVELEEDAAARAHALAERARARQACGDLDGAAALLAEPEPASLPDPVLRLRVELEEARGQPGRAVPALEALRARSVQAGDAAGERWAVRRLARLAALGAPSPAGEELLRRAVELDGDDLEALRALARFAQARGDGEARLAALIGLRDGLRRALSPAADEVVVTVEIAAALQALGRASEAEAAAEEATRLQPDHAPGFLVLAELLHARGELERAVETLRRADQLAPLSPEQLLRLADWLDERGDAAGAAAALDRAGAAAPPERRAAALEKAGRDAEAAALYRALGDPDSIARAARLEKRRAERARQTGRAAEARVAAVEALCLDPDDAEVFAWAADGLSPPAVLALLDELAHRLTADAAARLYRRWALAAGGEDARTALERSVALSPHPEALVALAERSPGEARALLRSALALDPASAPAALGLVRLAPPAEAAHALEEALTLTPEAEAATRARLAVALGALRRDALNDPAGARAVFRLAVAAASEAAPALRAEALRSLASLERAGGDAAAAEAALAELRQAGLARDSDVRHLAELLAERGAWAEAAALLRGVEGAEDLLLNCLEASGAYDELVARIVAVAPRKMPAEARALYLRAAQVAEEKLDTPARAAALLTQALPLGPSDAEIWTRLGRLYADKLGDPDQAAAAFARALGADRDQPELLLHLGDYHAERREWEPAHDYYVKALDRGVVPPAELGRVYLQVARCARRLADAIGEEEALMGAITFGAGAEARTRLARHYRERGDKLRLRNTLLAHLEEAEGEARLPLLRELVALTPEPEARELDLQILAVAPNDEEAVARLLARVEAGEPDEALQPLLEQASARASGPRRAALSLALGRLADRRRDDALAAAAYLAALEAAPGLDAARGLVDALGRQGRATDAGPALLQALADPRLDPAARGPLAELGARLHLEAGERGTKALAFVERARAAGLDVPLEPAVHRKLLRAELRFPELVAALDEAAAAAPTAEARLALELEAAEVLDKELGRRDEAARRYAAMLDRFPSRRDLAQRARQLFADAGEPIHALSALDKELRLAPPEEQGPLKIVRGELLLAAGADAEAEAEFLHALITTPRVGRAHAALAEVYTRRGDVAGSLEHLIAAAESPDLEPPRAAASAIQAADVLLREGDGATAERLYQLAAALDPASRGAVEGLARLAAAKGDHRRHADLLGRAALLATEGSDRARLLYARARLLELELDRGLDAYRALEEAVAADPRHLEAVRALRRLAEARGEWSVAADQLEREVVETAGVAERARLHVELARLSEERLMEPDTALAHYEQAALLFEEAGEARRAPYEDLARLHTNAQRLVEAAAALDRLAAALGAPGDTPRLAAVLERAGELYQRAGAGAEAKERLARAAALGGEAGRRADDSLLRLVGEGDDPEEVKRRVEERLAVEPEGPRRLELLRRLLELAALAGDVPEIDQRAQEVLARAPDDPLAFVERKRVLEARGDDLGLVKHLRARAAVVGDPAERAERLFEAGRVAERLGDAAGAAADYEQSLVAQPGHLGALDALADLAYRSRQLARARALYASLGETSSLLASDELFRRRAELAEDLGYSDEARAMYLSAARVNPSNLRVQEAVARLALARGDDAAAYQALRMVLDLLPLDEVDRITELRQQLGRLAAKLGDPAQARSFFELVLSQDPDRTEVLEELAVLYIDGQQWEEAAAAYERLSHLMENPAQRAEMLFRRGEVLRLALDDHRRASDAFLKAADLFPKHAPTLRRLVHYYYREGDFQALAEVARDLDAIPAPLDEAAVEVGLGLALAGDEARGTVVVAVAHPTGARLAETLALAQARDLGQLDAALRAASRALGGGEAGRQLLAQALAQHIAGRPTEIGARLALARLSDTGGQPEAARVQYAILAYVDPLGIAGTRLRELGPPAPVHIPEADRVHPDARGALRDALSALAPLVRGLPPSALESDPAPEWRERLAPAIAALGLDVGEFDAEVVVELADPAWVEPTKRPRLLLPRRVLGDEAVARFAAVRAFHLWASGVSLIERRPADDVAALVRAAAAIFLPDLAHRLLDTGPFVAAWRAELLTLGVRPERLPGHVREHLEVVLASCVIDQASLGGGAAYCAAERKSADRAALAATGDLRAALGALAPPVATTAELRREALADTPAIVDLLALVSPPPRGA